MASLGEGGNVSVAIHKGYHWGAIVVLVVLEGIEVGVPGRSDRASFLAFGVRASSAGMAGHCSGLAVGCGVGDLSGLVWRSRPKSTKTNNSAKKRVARECSQLLSYVMF